MIIYSTESQEQTLQLSFWTFFQSPPPNHTPPYQTRPGFLLCGCTQQQNEQPDDHLLAVLSFLLCTKGYGVSSSSSSVLISSVTKMMEALKEARASLAKTVERSKELAKNIEQTAPRLDRMRTRLPEIEKSIKPRKNNTSNPTIAFDIAEQIDRAVDPAAAVLRVFDTVHGFEETLLSHPPGKHLKSYLHLVTNLEQWRRFLADHCDVATTLLEDFVKSLEDNNVAEGSYLPALKLCIEDLRDDSKIEKDRLDGGLLDASLDRLHEEFERLLGDNTVALFPSEPGSDRARIAPSPLPSNVVMDLQVILERLTVNGRLDQCLSVYIGIRAENAKESLKALQLEYLQMQFDTVQVVKIEVENWAKHLEFVVRHLLEAEYKLCSDVFEKIGPEVWLGCFAEVAVHAGMLEFLKFAEAVAKAKPDPIKLLKLLDIFNALNNLRPDFHKLFADKACVEIRTRTSDVIKLIVEGACEIFRGLMIQVELQRKKPPPMDGGVPMLVRFLLDFCNQLLEEPYRAILTKVLVIERSWRREPYQGKILNCGILDIIRALEVNIKTWSKAFSDTTLSQLFMMNNHSYFYLYTKGTKLGNLLGGDWLTEHQQYKDYFAETYHRESWAKVPTHLGKEGLIFFSGTRAATRDLVKQRLKAFNAAFDDLYHRHSKWVISDDELREKMCHKVIQSLVPTYRSYMQSYGPFVEQEENSKKYAKYSAADLEHMIFSVFQKGPGRLPLNGTTKLNRTVTLGVANNGLSSNSKTNLYRTSSAVV